VKTTISILSKISCNCGIDHFGTAKIFDLGSVTSEGRTIRGTVLSRAPELFAQGATCTKASAVWAMGAVLFALRTGGDYPFVTRHEVRTKPAGGVARNALRKWYAISPPNPKANLAS